MFSNRKHTDESKRKMSDARKGFRHTEESKEKLRLAHQGKKHTEETKQKIGEAAKGRPVSEETRKKRSLIHKGKVISEESRRKMSEAKKGRPLSEEHKQHIREATIKGDTPEWRAKISAGVKKAYEREDFRENNLRQINSPEVRAKQKKSVSKPHAKEHNESIAQTLRESKREYWASKTPEERQEHMRKAIQASMETLISSLEIQIKSYLDEARIVYEQQRPIGPYWADFFLPEINVVLECYGCYWHGCKECGMEYAKKNSKDRSREAYIKACGFKLVVLWEHEIEMMGTLETPIKWLNEKLKT